MVKGDMKDVKLSLFELLPEQLWCLLFWKLFIQESLKKYWSFGRRKH